MYCIIKLDLVSCSQHKVANVHLFDAQIAQLNR